MLVGTLAACIILVAGFLILVTLRIPVAFALGIATIPVVLHDLRLTLFIECFNPITRSSCWPCHSSCSPRA
jgi:hypothetical protein